MFVSNNNPQAFDKVVKSLDSYFKLTDASGADVPVRGTVLPSKTSTFNQILELSPATPLRPDEWYTLTVQQGTDVQVSNDRSLEEVSSRPVAVWTIPFFTGSAPHVRAIETPGGAKDGSYVRVHFSEPVNLADIDATRLLTAGGRAYGKCLLLSGACATPPSDSVSETVDIAPVGRLGDVATPMTVTVNLPRTVRGSGRTVGDGADVARILTRGSTMRGRDLSREITTGSWHSCKDGASRCWTAAASQF